jgi:hypothetical protein
MFGRLFRYIFSNDVKMTMPVAQCRARAGWK